MASTAPAAVVIDCLGRSLISPTVREHRVRGVPQVFVQEHAHTQRSARVPSNWSLRAPVHRSPDHHVARDRRALVPVVGVRARPARVRRGRGRAGRRVRARPGHRVPGRQAAGVRQLAGEARQAERGRRHRDHRQEAGGPRRGPVQAAAAQQ